MNTNMNLDRNHDGKVDLKDVTGRPASAAHHNPLDRNRDGKVDLKDLTGRPGMNSQGLPMNQAAHNPLDRNFDGKVDSKDFIGQPGYVQSAQRSSIGQVRAEPAKVELIQKDVVVHEHIHPVQKEEIQPIIYREREQLDVKQVTQMMHETQIQPTIVQQRELPAERREAIIEKSAPITENYVAPSREVDATMRTQVVHAPIVNEVIKKTVVEEIQPVLERDIIQSTVIQETKPIYEKIVEAPHVYREVVTVQDRGVVGGELSSLEAQGFNLGSAGRRLSKGYTSAPLMNQGLPMNQGLGMNQGVAHHNPLDRNHDGRVDMNDLTGRPSMSQGLPMNQGLMNQGLPLNQGLGGETLLTNRGVQSGMLAGQTRNPLDRNNDGRVDMNDLTGRPGMNNQGLGMGQKTLNPLDRNNDGKVDLKDLTGRQSATTANRPVNTL